MALPVDVRSVDVLRAIREAFILFTDDSKHALDSMESEVRRCIDWLTHDQRIYWQNEVKRRKEKVSEAKAELHRKQISNMHGQNAHDSEQREGVREAVRRLEEAEDKVENVHRWLPLVERAVMEYNGQARPFADMLEFDAKSAIDALDRMITALDEYMALTAPVSNRPEATVVTSAANPIVTVTAPAETKPATEAKPEIPDEDKEPS